MRQRVGSLLGGGGSLLAVALGVGIYLMTRARGAICFSTVNGNTLRFGCGPGLSLPYFWYGFVLLVAGGFLALVLLAIGVHRWAQGRS